MIARKSRPDQIRGSYAQPSRGLSVSYVAPARRAARIWWLPWRGNNVSASLLRVPAAGVRHALREPLGPDKIDVLGIPITSTRIGHLCCVAEPAQWRMLLAYGNREELVHTFAA